MEQQKLLYVPIKEVIVGISVKNLYSENEVIETFHENFSLKEKFSHFEATKSFTFEFQNEPAIAQDIQKGIILSTENKTEQIIIEQDKLVYIDRSPYTSFEAFFEKYKVIVEEVRRLIQPEINVLDAGLRYINNFNLPMEHLHEALKVRPTINCQSEEGFFAYSDSYNSTANVVSLEDKSISAVVQTLFRVTEASTLNITFDIDARLASGFVLNNLYNFYNDLSKLRVFKNKIFFANFPGAYNLREAEPSAEEPGNQQGNPA